MIMIMRN